LSYPLAQIGAVAAAKAHHVAAVEIVNALKAQEAVVVQLSQEVSYLSTLTALSQGLLLFSDEKVI
jgi:hypothetical protein